MGCQYIMEFIVSDGNLKKIGFQAFKDCPRLRRLVLPNTLEEIGGEAFMNISIVCGGLVLDEELIDAAKSARMSDLPLSKGCLNNFDALLRRKTCSSHNLRGMFASSIILGTIFHK